MWFIGQIKVIKKGMQKCVPLIFFENVKGGVK